MDWVFHSIFLCFSVELIVDKKLVHLLVLLTVGVFFFFTLSGFYVNGMD